MVGPGGPRAGIMRYRAIRGKRGTYAEVRAQKDPTSAKRGTLTCGEVFDALEESVSADGQRRARMSRGCVPTRSLPLCFGRCLCRLMPKAMCHCRWVSIREGGPAPRRPLCVAEEAVQELLAGVPALAALSAAARVCLAESLEAVEVADGEPLVTAGAECSSLYFIEEGQAREDAGDEGGVIYTRGQWFCERRLQEPGLCPVTVLAYGGAVRCLKVHRSVFETATARHTPEPASPEPEYQPTSPLSPLTGPESEPEPSHIPRALEIDFADLTLERRIGSGATGTVHKGSHHGQDVAVKIFNTQDEMSDEEMKDFREEVKWLSTLRCSYVVLLVGVCTVVPNLSVVTEYLPRGSVYDIIHRHKVEIDFRRRMRMLLDVIKGMQYLEALTVIHRDLKSQNLLVDRSWKVKIADFGLARLLQSSNLKTIHGGAGTPAWMAPEVLREDDINSKADVYSFGVVIWEMVVLQVPWYDKKTPQIIMSVGLRGERLPLEPELGRHPQLRGICAACFREAADTRPTFEELSGTFTAYMQQLLQSQPIGRGAPVASAAVTSPSPRAEEGTPPSPSTVPQPSGATVATGAPTTAPVSSSSSSPVTAVASWGTEEVAAWLVSQGLPQDVGDTFRSHQVKGPDLLELTKQVRCHSAAATQMAQRVMPMTCAASASTSTSCILRWQEIKDDLGITTFGELKRIQSLLEGLKAATAASPASGAASTLLAEAVPAGKVDSPPMFGRHGGAGSGLSLVSEAPEQGESSRSMISEAGTPLEQSEDATSVAVREKKDRKVRTFYCVNCELMPGIV